MTYNHAFDVAFAVAGSEYPDWEDCLKNEKHLVIAALLMRVRHLIENNSEFLESISGFDTYEESKTDEETVA